MFTKGNLVKFKESCLLLQDSELSRHYTGETVYEVDDVKQDGNFQLLHIKEPNVWSHDLWWIKVA